MGKDTLYAMIVFLVFAGRVCGGVQWHRWHAKLGAADNDSRGIEYRNYLASSCIVIPAEQRVSAARGRDGTRATGQN